MTRHWATGVAVVMLVAFSGSNLRTQAPVPTQLTQAETVYLVSRGIQRELLDEVAAEFRRQGRFSLAASQSAADLIVTLGSGNTGDAVLVPVPGGGALGFSIDAMSLFVQDAHTGAVLWDDSRQINFRARGAALDLVKDLHAAVGRRFVTSLDRLQTVEELELQAEQGDADSSFELGVRYYLGNGVLLDYGEATKWLTLAVEQGDSRAQGYLDTLYANNQDISLDDIKSVRSAAERGHVVSQFNLGVMYANGKNVIQDHAEAMKWYGLAADGGHLGAQYNLGVMHHNGNGTPKNDRAAVLLWHSAAEHGHVGAQYNLGAMYADGEGVAQDDVTAHMWFNIVAARSSGGLRELAVENRELAAAQMTPEQLIEAQRLAREWELIWLNPL